MTAKFDTLEYAQQLAAAGVTPDQAKVHAKALLSVVGNCLDLPASVDSFKKEMKYEIDSLKNQITHELIDFRLAITHQLAELTAQQDLRIAKVEYELKIHRWMMGMLLALQIAILTKLFFP
jgi:hypothetical protein